MNKRGRKGVARAQGIGQDDLVSGHINLFPLRRAGKCAAVSEGDENLVQAEFIDHVFAESGEGASRYSQDLAKLKHLVIIELKDTGFFQGIDDCLPGVAILAKVDIKKLEGSASLFYHGIQRLPGFFSSLNQGAETEAVDSCRGS